MSNKSKTTKLEKVVRMSAKANGYSFVLQDNEWVLDKNVTVYVGQVADLLSGDCRAGFIRALSYYAEYYSSHHTKNICERVQHYFRLTGSNEVSVNELINYRSLLDRTNEWYLGTIKGFLKRWHRLGYPGVDDDVIKLLDGWVLKGNRKGDAVKRKHPEEGPLTDNELQAFNEGVVRAYERRLIALSELALCFVISNTGRRPVQISHLRVMDLMQGKNKKDEPFYVLNVPRGKQGDAFRSSFKPFAMTEELWLVVSTHANNIIKEVESIIGFELQDADRQQLPLFPDFAVFNKVVSPHELRQLFRTDKVHIASSSISTLLQNIVNIADIRSERTGNVLKINARRFRYTTGTRAAREGFGELVIAELLDHSDTQNAGVYIKNIPEHVKKLDEAVGFQLAPYAQAFAGVLVDSEPDAKRGDDPTSRIRTEEGEGVGTCGEYGFCNANVPIPCYTCMHFQAWLDGPHSDVYTHLVSERERLIEATGDVEVAAVLDRSILAVAQVIQKCELRRQELEREADLADV